jgi:type I restriction enzyme M protein
VLHGIDRPNLWHGNRLTGQASYNGLFDSAPERFDYIFTNPPFGGKEGKNAQKNFDYPTSATQVLFLQYCISKLKDGGTCAMVLDEGVLFRTNEDAFVKTKRKLLADCRVEAIISLPGGVFTQAGAGVKTNIVIFTKGQPTQFIWYYDLSRLNIRKRAPLTMAHFEEFLRSYSGRIDSEFSWTVDMSARKEAARAEARPFYEQAARLESQAQAKRKQIADLRRDNQSRSAQYQALQTAANDLSKEARQIRSKGEVLVVTVYDLKAVNPNAKVEEDGRTPEELIAIIEAKGKEVAAALALLKVV